MKYLMTYKAVPDFLPLAEVNGPAHVARLQEFHGRGLLLMAGPLTEPLNGDAIAVFTSQEALEEFVSEDPFVVNGVVDTWTARPWNEVLAAEQP